MLKSRIIRILYDHSDIFKRFRKQVCKKIFQISFFTEIIFSAFDILFHKQVRLKTSFDPIKQFLCGHDTDRARKKLFFAIRSKIKSPPWKLEFSRKNLFVFYANKIDTYSRKRYNRIYY